MITADTLITEIAQLATVPGPAPKRRGALAEIGLIANGALLIAEGKVVWAGPETELPPHTTTQLHSARGRAVIPGFVDAHTHLVFAGDRVAEFERRLQGASYQEILAAGGGILATVRQTRAASDAELLAMTLAHLNAVMRQGTTTVEAKTGYGLDTVTELRQLETLWQAAAQHPLTIVPTFLPAHAIPPNFAANPDDYVELIVSEMLPAALARRPAHAPLLFADVFCEAGVFTRAQTERILKAARDLGYALKVHVDEFVALGGTTLAVELQATSADHLMATPDDEIARLGESDTVAVLLPATTFGLGKHDWARARTMIEAGVAVAIATDFNPGTAWCVSMPFIMALATRYLGLSPAEALSAATLNGASALNLAHERGSLTPGYYADFLVLATDDYRHLAYRFGENLVAEVWKEGTKIDRSIGQR